MYRTAGREVAPGVTVWDPLDILCDAQTCSPIRAGRVLYSDHQHLSVIGALLLQEGISRVLFGPTVP